MKRIAVFAAAIGVALGGVASAHAALIGVQFDSILYGTHQGTVLTTSQTAGVIPQDNYNVLSDTNADSNPDSTHVLSGNLNDSNANPTGVTLEISGITSFYENSYTANTTNNEALLSAEFGTGTSGENTVSSPTVTFTFHNVSGAYDLIVYTTSNNETSPTQIIADGTTYYVNEQNGQDYKDSGDVFIGSSATSISGPYAAPVGNYVEIDGVTADSSNNLTFTLGFTPGTYTNAVYANAVQLQSVPEPASLGLLGLGSLLLLARRRKLA